MYLLTGGLMRYFDRIKIGDLEWLWKP